MHLRLGFINMMPYIHGSNGNVTGMFTTLAEALFKSLNFSYTYKEAPDWKWGTVDENGTWDGQLGTLQRNEIDLTLGPFVLEEKRLQTFEFLEFHSVTSLKILASVDKAGTASFLNFLFTFESMIWICLISSFLVMVVLSAFDEIPFGSEERFSRKLSLYFWMYLASMFLEGSFRTPRKALGKLLLSIWLLSILVLMNGFSGQFKALLMLRQEGEIINRVQDLATRPHIVLVIPKTTVYEKNFRVSEFEDYQKIYQNSVKHGAILSPYEYTFPHLYQRVKRGELVITTILSILQNYVRKYCDHLKGNRRMYFVKEPLDVGFVSFLVTKDFPRTPLKMINKKIVGLRECGLIDKWLEILNRGYQKCLQGSDPSSEEGALSLDLLLPIFLIFMAAQGASFLCFLWEVFGRRIKTRICGSRTNAASAF